MISKTFKKPNPKRAEELEKRIANLRLEIEEDSGLLHCANSEEWQKIVKILERKLAEVDAILDNYEIITDKQITSNLQKRLDMKMFKSFIEGSEWSVRKHQAELAQSEKELEELKERLG